MLSTLLVGCDFNSREVVVQTIDDDVPIVELCEFLCNFVQKTYAPTCQADIDEVVGDAVGIIDTTILFHYLIRLSKEIDKDKYVEIIQVSYSASEGSSDNTSNIMIRFNLHLSYGAVQPMYIRFDLNDVNTIIGLQQNFENL